jgi:hypothetical protein
MMTVEATALLHKPRKVLWTPRQYKTFCEFIRTVEGVWPNYPISIELEFRSEEMEVCARGPLGVSVCAILER